MIQSESNITPLAEENAVRFRFCPSCGHEAVQPDSSKSFACADCGFTFFLNAAAAVVAVIVDDGCVLLTVRSEEPAAGALDLPGGFVDPYESLEHALHREIKEELGLAIESARYLCSVWNRYVYKDVVYATIDLAYQCAVPNARSARPRDDVAAVRFLPLDTLDVDALGLRSVREILRYYTSRD
jgi:ADP-ribose pyrophosphatase YjhB (NUDIX family)